MRISEPLESGEREIQVGRHVAYGTVERDGQTYALAHAPTQEDFDAVAAALDAATPAQIHQAFEVLAHNVCEHSWHRFGTINGQPDVACQLCGKTQPA